MSLAVVYSRAQLGVRSPLVNVEVHLSNGLPGLSMVGLPETAVRESKDRVRGAILNSQFDFPARRITINLAPADLPKEGGRFDLPIALGILAASGQVEDHRRLLAHGAAQVLVHREGGARPLRRRAAQSVERDRVREQLRPVHGLLQSSPHLLRFSVRHEPR